MSFGISIAVMVALFSLPLETAVATAATSVRPGPSATAVSAAGPAPVSGAGYRPVMSSWGGGRFDLFIRGTDNQIYWSASADYGLSWTAWSSISIETATAEPAAVSTSVGNIDVFIRSSTGSLKQDSYYGGSWHGFVDRGGNITGGPGVSSWSSTRIDVFGQGTDGALWHLDRPGAGVWQSHGAPPGGFSSDPQAVSWGYNRIDVFVKGNSGSHGWHLGWDGSNWGPWQDLGGGVTSILAAASAGTNLLDVYGQGTDGNVWATNWNGTSWISWHLVGAPAAGIASGQGPTAYASSTSRTDLFVRGNESTNKQIWHTSGSGSTWAAWNAVTDAPGAPTNVTAVVSSSTPNAATVSWTAPAYQGISGITGYTVTPYLSGAAGQAVNTSGGTSAVVGGLLSGVSYSFTVTANNVSGSTISVSGGKPVTPGSPAAGGGFGQSIYTVGAHQHVLAGFTSIDTIPSLSSAWTVEGSLWGMNATLDGGTTSIGSQTSNTSASLNAGFDLEQGSVSGSGLWCRWPGGSQQINNQTSTPATRTHYAVSWDGHTVRCYINGNQMYYTASDTPGAGLPASYAGVAVGGNALGAQFDEIRVSSVARYTGTTFPPAISNFANDSSTAGLWHFDNYPTSKLIDLNVACDGGYQSHPGLGQDSSGNGHHAQVVGYYLGHGPGWCGNPWGSEGASVYSVGVAVDIASLTGGGLPWMCPCAWSSDKPVNTATGEFWHSFDDLTVPGRGRSLDLARTYSSSQASTIGAFGYGWTSSYAISLGLDGSGNPTVHAGNGSSVAYAVSGPPTAPVYTAPTYVWATLVKNANGTYTLTDKDQGKLVFDSGGRLTTETDRNGYATTMAYDASSRLGTVIDSAGRTLTLAYNASNLVQSVIDTASPVRSVTYTYDASSNLTQVTDVLGGVARFGYDANHLMLNLQDPRCTNAPTSCTWTATPGPSGTGTGCTVIGTTSSCVGLVNTYDGSRRVTSQYDGLGSKTSFDYSLALRTTLTDPLGKKTTFEYLQNQLVSRTDAVGTASQATSTFYHDPSGAAVTMVSDGAGRTTSTVRDARSNVLSSTDPLGRKHTYTYNSFGEVLTDTDPLNIATTNSYDSSGNLAQASRPLNGTTNRVTHYYYDDSTHPGDVTRVLDPNGKTWSSTYDSNGYLSSSIDPLGNKQTYTHDAVGRLTSSVTPRGNVSGGTPATYTSIYETSAFGDITKVTDPLSHVTRQSYDPNRNLATATDANNHVTTYVHDADNRTTRLTRPDTTNLDTAYDADGNMISQTDGRGQTTAYHYDALNHVDWVKDPLLRQTSYTSDLSGNPLTLTDPSGNVTSLAYDAASELTAVRYSDLATPNISFTYDADGQRATMADGTGSTTYTIDQLHRITQVQFPAGTVNKTLGYGYDLKGQMTSITYPGQATPVGRAFNDAGQLSGVTDWASHSSTFAYSPDHQLTGISYANGASATYGPYDAAGRLPSITAAFGGTNFLSQTYTRDSVGQLTGDGTSTFANDSLDRLSTLNGTTSYTYDAADDLKSTPSMPATTYDVANQLTAATISATAYTFSYDTRGNRLTQNSGGAPGTSYAYDQANRLASTGTLSFNYNGDGLRMSMNNNGTVSQLTWNTASGLPTLLQDGTTNYISGPAGLPIEMIDGSGAQFYFHADQLGSTRNLTNSSGAVVASYTYDSWGKTTSRTGSASTPLQFAGQYLDPSNLYYLRARYYDPSTGQFISRDPAVATTRQPYSYTNDNPLNGTDPSGLDTNGWCLSQSVAFFIGAGVDERCIVWDGTSVALTHTYGASTTKAATTPGVTGLIAHQRSNGDTVDDLAGPFVTASGSAAFGCSAGGGAFLGRNHDGSKLVAGYEVGVGGGSPGVDGGVGATNTDITAKFQVPGWTRPIVDAQLWVQRMVLPF